MDYEKLFPGRFIKSADLDNRDVTLEIRAVRAEEIEGKPKAIVSFHGTKKELVMNRTNAESLKLMFGRETNDWLGKKVTIYPVTIPDPFNPGGTTRAIRVRGSPHITTADSATIQRGKKTIKVSVVPTGRNARANVARQQPAEPPPPPPPEHDEYTGEILGEPPLDVVLPGDREVDGDVPF